MAETLVNRLDVCTSPYLLQHASNPVAWQPWDDEAIESARRLNRPILVSIGYSACHWCHVMEHESFDIEETAQLMNSKLVCIKVDREERPDVDALYMAACQITTGGGGWPLNAFLDPESLRPFFAGTYFPPQPRFGRPSWSQLVKGISRSWQSEKEKLLASSVMITNHLQMMSSGAMKRTDVEVQIKQAVTAALQHSLQAYDTVNGGMGAAPKFPHTMELEGLLRAGEHEMVTHSLEVMATRGLFDHLAGGWHRYCVDAEWSVPHFEKMLYDNALLLAVHEKARRMGVGKHNDRVVRLTLEWLHNEMLDPDGGVWSTLDADSVGEDGKSEEGEFYLWTPDQAEDEIACQRFGITKNGNFENSERSVLSLHEVDGLAEDEDERLRHFLLDKRSGRPRPGTDDKVLTAWNGMLLVACAELPEPEAESIGQHIVKEFLSRSEIIRTRRGDTLGGEGFLDDYAWAALGLLRWGLRWDSKDCLKRCLEITSSLIDRFSDPDGGFWLTGPDHTRLPIRQRSVTDAAVPGASAMVVELLCTLLLRWPEHADASEWRRLAENTISTVGDALIKSAGAYWSLINAAQGLFEGGEVWFIHHSGDEPAEVENLRRSAGWNQLVISSSDAFEGKERGSEKWMAWFCEKSTCRTPTNDADDIKW